MTIDRIRQPSKYLVYLLVMLHVLTACSTTSGGAGGNQVGPKPSSSYGPSSQQVSAYKGPDLDVVIPVFSPGLSEDAANYEEDGVWPELRRAEANRFAYKLKLALEKTGLFGAVRVTPDSTASGDIYVLGEIVESNGIDVEFNMDVIDASGKQWLDDSVDYEVGEGFYKNPRANGQDAYDPIFDIAAEKIVEALLKQQPGKLSELKKIADLRFASSFNDEAFADYLDTDSTPMKLVAMPSDADPLYQRTQSIRVREQLFVDSLQDDYSGFSQQMENSYIVWQKASATETRLKKEARNKSIMKILGGIALVAAGIAAASSGDRYDRNIGRDVAAVAAGIGGSVLLTSGITSTSEA